MDCWLWPEADGIRWWTPDATEFLVIQQPGDQEYEFHNAIAELRDGSRTLSLMALVEPLRRVISDALQQHRACLRLHLSGRFAFGLAALSV